MRRTISKCFWAWDFEKEEIWLNEMAAKGLVLVAIGFCRYTFEECLPGEYNVRLELLNNVPTNAESQQYIKFLEESGAEYLGSVMRWVYFRRKTDNGEFNLYSDNASRIKLLNRVLTLVGCIGITSICTGLGNIGTQTTANLIFGITSLILGLFITFGFLQVYRKKRNLQKQRNLFE
ncbi:hypothetical protein Sgly_2086 [Syntrophobotulus glycolicus DSM 8271]|uniref:DUF2812 domain-containing protein n=1 Tax=Syntrophobotulus glycolicus (strain DSM 8271 / FlGlyR) TaxID=645991 RepID=F0T234_SYNGF|nr:DUF2812 domain-containing protein [Syntrophobotulus glycolicus]ADY56378.1 hypothetical protein Sgly_2086 [Syntrophobotulus glycolicus DSM 8271]